MSETSNLAGFELLIPEHLMSFGPEAMSRLQYLVPEVSFSLNKSKLVCFGPEETDWAAVRQEVYYTLCRAKIRSEGAAQRMALYDSVFEG